MKNYEKKSFLTTLFLFLVPLILFAGVVLYMYTKDKTKDLEQNILYQMKEYTFDFQGDKFSLDIVEDNKQKDTFKIYHSQKGLCAYFAMPSSSAPYLLKVLYDKNKYEKEYQKLLSKVFNLGLVILIFLLILSVGFTLYSLKPMREAISLLEAFLKDLIHDLNTPATSILLNSKLLRRRGDFEEIGRIELSAKTIASLYKNLELITPSKLTKEENILLSQLVNERVELLKKIYPKIEFIIDMKNIVVKSNTNAIERILDNLLTNACKYNKKNGQVIIKTDSSKLVIKDTGIGIKDTKKVFQRYYKENDSGLGIGMSIVKQLCETLGIEITIQSVIGKGTTIILNFE